MASIYLAASFARREELSGYADRLRERGHAITSRWLTSEKFPFWKGEMPVDTAALCAQYDVEDVLMADTLIGFTNDPKVPTPGGGRHVELGIALATHKRILLVGPREHVFHCLPTVEFFDRFEAAVAWLQHLKNYDRRTA